ncbi:MAG: thioredoxin-disulfide reductase [Clostridia bacterium]|nr:MAG: thioredoxin-disulfide reductase [Clostridia bacterium]
MSDLIIYSHSENFRRDVLENPLPVVLDFYSDECPPCTALAPLYERLAERYWGRVSFVKIFRQENRTLAESLGVTASPTLIFYRQGQEVGPRLNGFISKRDLRLALEDLLGEAAGEQEKKVATADLIILGGGPAGLTAAIYAGRARLNTVVIDESLPGGQAASTYHLSNYPGTGGSVSGRELMDKMLAQALSLDVRVDDFKEVTAVDLTGPEKVVVTEDTEYRGRAIILATGARPRKLPVPGADERQGHGVHYCATCDGIMYEGQSVIVVGGGNSAVEEAVYLTRYAEKVTLVHEFDHLQASKIAQEQALANPRIEFVWECHVREIAGDDGVTGVTVKHLPTGEKRFVPGNGIFVYIGTEPQTALFQGQVEMTAQGYLVTDAETRTSQPGVFAAGDVRAKEVRQVVAAAGDGAVAAVQAEKYLAKLEVRG